MKRAPEWNSLGRAAAAFANIFSCSMAFFSASTSSMDSCMPAKEGSARHGLRVSAAPRGLQASPCFPKGKHAGDVTCDEGGC